MIQRTRISLLSVSAAALLAIAGYEGYSSVAYTPVQGDVPTIGWGTTSGVSMGDTITPTQALTRLVRDAELSKAGIEKCVKVPLSQNELDAYLTFAYNIGPQNFCSSTLVKKLNKQDYDGACAEIKRWVYFKKKKLQGLVNRREKEYALCMKR